MMTDRNELIKAAELIKEYCSSIGYDVKDCSECIFLKSGACSLFVHSPENWRLPKPRRFTDEDIALAKALKEFGVEGVYKTEWGSVDWVMHGESTSNLRLPTGAFESLQPLEAAKLDWIIAEGEE